MKCTSIMCNTQILYKGESNENLKYFYLVIYWTQNVHNDFMFLCSLHCVPYKCSSDLEVHVYLACVPLEKKSFGWECSRLCTACCTSSLDLKDLHPIATLSGPKTWKSLGTKSGEYSGCGRHSKDRLGLLQQLNGQYGTEHCHVEAKHLYSDIHVIWTWLQDAGNSLDLHTLYCSQCFPWACGAPKLPLVYPNRESA